MSEPYYVTTAITYPNGAPHVGHAYEYIATDAIARFKRLDGFDVRFLTGTDEHGLKMAQTAEAEGIPTADLTATAPACTTPGASCDTLAGVDVDSLDAVGEALVELVHRGG